MQSNRITSSINAYSTEHLQFVKCSLWAAMEQNVLALTLEFVAYTVHI